MSALGIHHGTVIGRDFRVVQHLASGAMGSVYVVEQLSTGKHRALKVMSLELGNNDRARDRFVLEARVGAKIESDHVVEVVTAGIDEATNAPYLVMELLRGEELADKIHREGRLPLEQVAEILRQAGHALEQAHMQGIVHRDIKPENLFIAESRRDGVPFTVKILDFGIAKLVAERTAEGTQPVGTPLFMAPEQTDRRGLITPATDVWPLGLIAFFLLTGTHYWLGGSQGITALLREVVMEPLSPASERSQVLGVGQFIPPGFDAWFAKCVHRDPRQRYAHAGECVRGFRDLMGGAMPTMVSEAARTQMAPPAVAAMTGPQMHTGNLHTAGGTNLTAAASMVVPQPKKSNAAGIAIGALVAAGAAGGGIYFLTREKPAEPVTATSSAPSAAESGTAPAAPVRCPDGMIRIEAGAMFMGSTDEDLDENVRPPHKVKVSAFCLDKTEVTVAAYAECAKSGNCLRPKPKVSFPDVTDAEVEEYSKLCNYGQADKGTHPMNCVDFTSAKQFCESEGGRLPTGGARLPTEAEWEFAARGSGQRVFPWGDEPPGPKKLNACADECVSWLNSVRLTSFGKMFDGNDGHPATAPVGSYPEGASSAGVLDLAGNVWEWTADWYGRYRDVEETDPTGPSSGDERVARGGGFNGLKPSWAKPAFRWKTPPDTVSHGIGFRCAFGLEKK